MALNSSIIFSSYIDTKLTFAINNNITELIGNDYADVSVSVSADGDTKTTSYRIFAGGGNVGITMDIRDKSSISYTIGISASYTFFRTDIRGNGVTTTGTLSKTLSGTMNNTGTMVSPTDVAISITNASYTQDSTGQRIVIFDVPYSIINQSSIPLNTNVDLYVQFKKTDGITTLKTLILLRTLSTTNGSFHVDIRDNTILTETSLIVECFMWLRNTTDPIAQPIQKGLTMVSSSTVPVTPVLSVTPIDKYNFILSWTGNTNDLFNLERATSTQNYSSVFGDLQDTDNQVQLVIQPITETYFYRLRTKNSVGYSNYSNVITVVNTEIAITPQTNWVTSEIVLAEFKDNLLSVPVSVTKNSAFDPSFNNEQLFLILQIKNSSGVVVDTKQTSFDFSIVDIFAEFFEDTYDLPSVTIDLFVWDSQNRSYSTKKTITVTNQITQPPIGQVPNTPTLTGVYNLEIEEVFLEWNIDTNADLYNVEANTPLFPSWFSFAGDFTPEVFNGKYAVSLNLSDKPFGEYKYRIRAKNSVGYSNYSNIVIINRDEIIPPDGEATQEIVQISTPNNNNTIRAVLNPQNLAKWKFDNDNSLLCNYPEFAGLDVPCSLSYFETGSMVSEADNFQSVIAQIASRYSGVPIPTTTGFFKKIIGVFALGTTTALLLTGGKK